LAKICEVSLVAALRQHGFTVVSLGAATLQCSSSVSGSPKSTLYIDDDEVTVMSARIYGHVHVGFSVDELAMTSDSVATRHLVSRLIAHLPLS
jgi:hypothetical protein